MISKEISETDDRMTTRTDPRNAVAATICSLDFLEAQQMVREIDNAKLLQEELIRRDPSFASGSTMLETESEGAAKDKLIKGASEIVVEVGDRIVEDRMIPTQIRMGARVLENQRKLRILVAKSMLEEELAKDEPSAASVSVLKSAAYGRDEPVDIEMLGMEIVADAVTGEMTLGDNSIIIDNEIEPEGTCRVETEEVDDKGVISDDAAMSVGDSDEEEEGSDGFSRSSSSSSHGESNLSRGSRKRPADESPEREQKEGSHREFPGAVTRSEGGCRIYVPLRVAVQPVSEVGPTVAVTTRDGTITLETAVETVTPTITEESIAIGAAGEVVALDAVDSVALGAVDSVALDAVETVALIATEVGCAGE